MLLYINSIQDYNFDIVFLNINIYFYKLNIKKVNNKIKYIYKI